MRPLPVALLAVTLLAAAPARSAPRATCEVPLGERTLDLSVAPQGAPAFLVRVTDSRARAHLLEDRVSVEGALRFDARGALALGWHLARRLPLPHDLGRVGPREELALGVRDGALVAVPSFGDLTFPAIPVPCDALTLAPKEPVRETRDRFDEELAKADDSQWVPRARSLTLSARPEDGAPSMTLTTRYPEDLRFARSRVEGAWVRVVWAAGTAAFAGWARAVDVEPYRPDSGGGMGMIGGGGGCAPDAWDPDFEGTVPLRAGATVYASRDGAPWATVARAVKVRVRWRVQGGPEADERVQLLAVPGLRECVERFHDRQCCDELRHAFVALDDVTIPERKQLLAAARARRPAPVGAEAVAAARAALPGGARIAIGAAHACALRDGAVLCWGDGASGALGDGTTAGRDEAAPVPGVADATALAAGSGWTCALRISAGGAVWCWGRGIGGDVPTPTVVAGLGGPVVALAGRGDRLVALLADGRVAEREGKGAPHMVEGLGDAVAITTGGYHACALRVHGDVTCWGLNRDGQLGLGDSGPRAVPFAVPGLAGVVSVAAGSTHTCAALRDGTVRCWGNNDGGVLGLEARYGDVPTPTAVPGLADVTALAAGDDLTCALRRDGSVACFGASGARADGAFAGQLAYAPNPAVVTGQGAAVEVAVAGRAACLRGAEGPVRCWGARHVYGSLPVAGLSGVRIVRAGYRETCALRDDGSVPCWPADRDVRRAFTPDPAARDLAAAAGEVCRVTGEGRVECRSAWGRFGEVEGVTRLALDTSIACLVAKGRLACEMVDDHRQTVALPVPVELLGEVVDVDVTFRGWCSVEASGRVVCWEAGRHDEVTTPPEVLEGVDDAVEVALSLEATCVRRRGGEVLCTEEDALLPVPDVEAAVSLAVDDGVACAALEDGRVRCWPREYGSGRKLRWGPARVVPGVEGATQVTVDEGTACARIGDGTVRCWGRADGGRADGLLDPVAVPGTE